MAPVAKISKLPRAVRAQLDKRLAAAQFGQLRECSQWLASRGYQVGKTAIGNYARGLMERQRLQSTPPEVAALRLACLQIAAVSGAERTVLTRARRYLAWVANPDARR